MALAMLPEEAVIGDRERIGAVQAQCEKAVDYEAMHKESDAAWASLIAQWKAAPAERLKAAEKAAEQARAEAQAPFDQAWAKQIAQWKAATAEKVKAAEKAARAEAATAEKVKAAEMAARAEAQMAKALDDLAAEGDLI